MIKINTSDSQEVYLSKDSIKEIVVVPNSNEIIIYTTRTKISTNKTELKRILDEIQNPACDYLTKAIRDLTNLLKARMH